MEVDTERNYLPLLFVDIERCVGIININNNETITKWLYECGLDPKGSVHVSRELLLDFVQEILTGKTKPPAVFLTSILQKLLSEALIDELQRRGLSQQYGRVSIAEKRQIIAEHIIEAHTLQTTRNTEKIRIC